MQFNINQLNNQDRYRLLNGGVTPRPIAWVSSCSADGVDNLAPYSFFTVASCTPPVLLFTTVMPRDGALKDSLQNIKATKSCVVNIVPYELLSVMSATSASLANNVSEFEIAGVEACKSATVDALSVAGAPVRYECTLREIIQIADTPGAGTMTLLDVQSVYVRDGLCTDGVIDQTMINSVGKMGGDSYVFTGKVTELVRPA